MKVLFINRPSVFSVPGGDTIQMMSTAKALEKLGVEIDVFQGEKNIDYEQYDLLHFFNITRPASILNHIQNTDKAFVVSPIFADYSYYKDINLFSKMGLLTTFFGPDGLEYIKTFAKHFLGKEKISYSKYFIMGQKKSIQTILNKISCLLPNSESEYQRLLVRYKTDKPYVVVPNGVDVAKFKATQPIKRISKQVLCVGLVESRKNQYYIIKALQGTDFTLKIIGDPAPNHQNYLRDCKAIADESVEFIPRISQEELVKHYLESEIHILPSWFETTGLSSLEAGLLGCKVIVSPKGDTRDYFKDQAIYCDPSSVTSIKEAIEKCHKMEYNSGLKDLIEKEYIWEKTAEKTYKAYCQILNQDL